MSPLHSELASGRRGRPWRRRRACLDPAGAIAGWKEEMTRVNFDNSGAGGGGDARERVDRDDDERGRTGLEPAHPIPRESNDDATR